MFYVILPVIVLIGGLALYLKWGAKQISSPTNGARIDRNARPETALVIIDVQDDWTRNPKVGYAETDISDLIAHIQARYDAARKAGAKIVTVRQVFTGWLTNLVVKLVSGGAGAQDSDGLKLDDRLKINADADFTKPFGDAFSNPEFERWLEAQKVGQLVLVGLDGCHCVQLTAKGALNRGFDVEILTDGVIARHSGQWDWYLDELRGLGATAQ